MDENARLPYLVEEDILIVELYTRTPRSKIRIDNPEIAELASFFTVNGRLRNPSGIKMKMENLKSVDEAYLDNGKRKGMTGISSQLKDVWSHYCSMGFAEIDEDVDRARKAISSGNTSALSEGIFEFDNARVDGSSSKRTVNVRDNQSLFRSRVLACYDGKCCITGLDVPEMLQACHIKPWNSCTDDQS